MTRSSASGRCVPGIASLALLSALMPSAAWAQDASALAVIGGPPLLLAPFVAALLRRAWLRRTSGAEVPWRRFLPLSLLEFALWLAIGWLAVLVHYREAWGAGVLLCGALIAILAVDRLLVGARGAWLSWVASAAVLPSVTFLLLIVSLAVAWAFG